MAALAAYRHLLRATRVAFEGDLALLTSARLQARDAFDKNRTLDSLSKNATEAVAHAEGVAQVLRHNIVQGRQKDGTDVLKLRIHNDTEQGDNESIKKGRKTGVIGGFIMVQYESSPVTVTVTVQGDCVPDYEPPGIFCPEITPEITGVWQFSPEQN